MKARFIPTVAALSLAVPMVFNSFVCAPTVFADSNTQEYVDINTGNFPDLTFLDCVRAYDTNKDSKLSLAEREAVTTMWINNRFPKIESIEGLEYFPNVTQVEVSDNALETVDLSKYPQIERFYVRNNKLTYINLRGCKDLTRLAVQGNKDLKIVDISLNSNLLDAYEKGTLRDNDTYYEREYSASGSGIYYNKTTTLFTGGIDIATYFPDNDLQSFVKFYDLDNNGRLDAREIKNITLLTTRVNDKKYYFRDLTGLEFLTSLQQIYLIDAPVTFIDVSTLSELTTLKINGTGISELDISKNKKMEVLLCHNTPIKSVDISNCPHLIRAVVWSVGVKYDDSVAYDYGDKYYLRISNKASLIYSIAIDAEHFSDPAFRQYISENIDKDKNGRLQLYEREGIEKIDVSNLGITTLKGIELFPCLKELDCSGNNIKSLDLTGNKQLVTLRASKNKTLEQIEMNEKIVNVDLHSTNMSYLKLEKYRNIRRLDMYGTYISNLDVTGCPGLQRLDVGNTLIENLDVTHNPELECLNISGTRINDIDLKSCPEILKIMKGEPSNVDGMIVYGTYFEDLFTGKTSFFAYTKANPITPTPVPPTATPAPKSTATPTAKPTATTAPKATATATPKPSAPDATATPTVTTAPAATKSPDATVTPEVTTAPSKDPKEQIRAFVDRIYIYVLDREPEDAGAGFWTDELYGFRRTGAEVAQGFIFSDEFINRNTSDKDFVTILYKTFFGREADEAGMNYWLEQLSTGAMDRVTVANGFIFSQEWADTCAKYGIRSGGDLKPTFNIEPTELTYAFVERMYTTALGREYDKEGKEYWASELSNFNISGEQLGASFFLSEEMVSYNLDDKEYVDRLYKTFMDREADADGAAYWLSVLASGTSRADVVYGFTRSPEFTEKCIEARILPF